MVMKQRRAFSVPLVIIRGIDKIRARFALKENEKKKSANNPRLVIQSKFNKSS